MSILRRFRRRVRTKQSLREFTVQILHRHEDRILGTGFIFQPEGKILTCAHVVCDAVGEEAITVETVVRVRFRREQIDSADRPEYQAKVMRHFHQVYRGYYYDDVVVLELVGEPDSLIDMERMARLEPAYYPDRSFDSSGNPFRSYGYRPVDNFVSGSYADGEIRGPVDGPSEIALHADPLQLKSHEIGFGMSGAALLDMNRGCVVGVITHSFQPSPEQINPDKAYGADAKIVLLSKGNV